MTNTQKSLCVLQIAVFSSSQTFVFLFCPSQKPCYHLYITGRSYLTVLPETDLLLPYFLPFQTSFIFLLIIFICIVILGISPLKYGLH
jgi:hypothetical protein